MKKYVCSFCGYRYVPAREEMDEEDGIIPNEVFYSRVSLPPVDHSEFKNLSEAWRCPNCGALKKFFHPEKQRGIRNSPQ